MAFTFKHARNKWFSVLVATVLFLILLRAAAPYAVQYYVNQQLEQTQGITGHVGDVDLYLYRGAYAIDDVEIYAVDATSAPKPLLAVQTLDFSLAWSALLKGNLVTNMAFSRPEIVIYDKDPSTTEQNQQVKDETTWVGLANDLVLFSIDTLRINNGKVSLVNAINDGEKPTYISNINAEIKNITNAQNLSKTLVTSLNVEGALMGEAALSLNGKLDPFSEQANFDFNVEVQRFSVKNLETVFKVYTPFDIEAGGIDGAMELAANNNNLNGYVKAGVHNLSVFSWREDIEKDDDGLFTAIFEGSIDLLSSLLENDDSKLVAARIPIEGQLDNADVSTFQAVVSVLKNAFFDAFKMKVDNVISFEDTDNKPNNEGN
ncbi:DUF748 domain-containing protein [Pseudoalteromonas carrageenovora]|uniref:DUF748 domain-containing protein n=1 Tax=Pseudoalteromonas carrageenovora IAM 12662 TaxID=1314868 RepID=A0A2K4XFS5_PSEVC|nr:DUF748 domain-containing protein [Pseudoalteromonas carrageenovora]MBE0384789.1 hypothetical protein [Pseudoalteromonas carrageenovora IAM 12662]MDO6463599.1 DUF748 domain-containing protein [Pseudoalteromonas carrageenovora]MDO6546311.1 DUF748 domain-containing protein [Pseudoalteromonas carrageenovora]MDO6830850.1 DUF748 domain-containing protein [Pseudoalteromonas carrageenovora]MDO6835415.1 DUF748 domain-containing protein [Pseudoalteromonas carrageenovora]|tara:strand:- start:3811 stop:4935 length:1125 start_codon:yes stop_codon:yes gene_type:complete